MLDTVGMLLLSFRVAIMDISILSPYGFMVSKMCLRHAIDYLFFTVYITVDGCINISAILHSYKDSVEAQCWYTVCVFV